MKKLIRCFNEYKKYLLIALIVILIVLGIIINNIPNKKVISNTNEIIKNYNDFVVDLKGEVVNPNKYYFNKEMYLFEIIEIALGFTSFASMEGINLIEKIDYDCVISIAKDESMKAKHIEIIDYSNGSNFSYLYIENTLCIYKFNKDKSFEEIFWLLGLDNDIYHINLMDKISEDTYLVLKEALLNINKADYDDLKKLNILSDTVINNILLYIKENKRIKDFNELDSISGIGEKTLEKLKNVICFN